jgi:hypothetical protein
LLSNTDPFLYPQEFDPEIFRAGGAGEAGEMEAGAGPDYDNNEKPKAGRVTTDEARK